MQALQAIYRPGYKFAKAGVMLLDIQSVDVEQAELDLDADTPHREGLMGTMDSLNERYGQGSVALASAGLRGNARAWMMKQSFKTPGYTTHWADIPVAKAC